MVRKDLYPCGWGQAGACWNLALAAQSTTCRALSRSSGCDVSSSQPAGVHDDNYMILDKDCRGMAWLQGLLESSAVPSGPVARDQGGPRWRPELVMHRYSVVGTSYKRPVVAAVGSDVVVVARASSEVPWPSASTLAAAGALAVSMHSVAAASPCGHSRAVYKPVTGVSLEAHTRVVRGASCGGAPWCRPVPGDGAGSRPISSRQGPGCWCSL